MNLVPNTFISSLLCLGAATVGGAFAAERLETSSIVPVSPTPTAATANKAPASSESVTPSISSSLGSLPGGKTDQRIRQLEQTTKEKPEEVAGWAELAEAYLQKSRETNDPLYYSRMDAALTQAVKLQPDHYTSMKLRSLLHSSRHQFEEAIQWTEKAIKENPDDPLNYGTLGDIYAELGQYEKVEANYQKMMDLLPGRASYARASYFAELHGDERSARALMLQAIEAGKPRGEDAAWCYSYLGHLNFNGGFLPAAQKAYESALESFPGYFHAYIGMGKVKAAQKDFPAAIEMYQNALKSGPHHEALAALIEIYAHTGQKDKAKEVRSRLGELQERYQKYDMDIDFEVAEIDAEHGRDLSSALKLAKEEVQTHGNVKAYDSLAWIAYLNGDMETAKSAMEKALSIGSQYPIMFYHAGKIQEKLGDKQGSIRMFNRALSKAPAFHIRYAADARKSVERLTLSLTEESRRANAASAAKSSDQKDSKK